MRSEDILDILYEISEYLASQEDVIGDEGDIPNKAMRLNRDLTEVIKSLGGE